MTIPPRRDYNALLILASAIWLTRSHHFASLAHLPDASWAAFFIAGLLGLRAWAPAALMVNAGVIDYLALLGGVSDYCVTPAYAFLAPTYLTLWASGRWAGLGLDTSARGLARTALALTLGVAGAFVISNVSFYALAGYFAQTPALDYANAVMRYLPRFLESAALYTGVALVAIFAPQALAAALAHRRANAR